MKTSMTLCYVPMLNLGAYLYSGQNISSDCQSECICIWVEVAEVYDISLSVLCILHNNLQTNSKRVTAIITPDTGSPCGVLDQNTNSVCSFCTQ